MRRFILIGVSILVFTLALTIGGGFSQVVEADPGHTRCLGAPAAAEIGVFPAGPSREFGENAAFLATTNKGLHDIADALHDLICEPKNP